ncbi:hypothetical protein ABZ784_28890 [Streptomyces tendae]|uniref:hypothetical protein n=1 Tax=Streptomyces tendae TaxID=1932 RepID=UPI0033C2AFB1
MTVQTFTPPTSPFARDPFYAMGAADAYDEHHAGHSIHDLLRRADEMLDVPSTGRDSVDLYVCGYGNAVRGLLDSHIAQINAQADVAQTWLARKQGRETSTLHQRHRSHR